MDQYCQIEKINSGDLLNDLYNLCFKLNYIDPENMELNGQFVGLSDIVSELEILTMNALSENSDSEKISKYYDLSMKKIITLAKNVTTGAGLAPDNVIAQAKAIFDSAKAIPSQPAIERRREQLGLPAVAAPDVNELQTLLKNIGADKKL